MQSAPQKSTFTRKSNTLRKTLLGIKPSVFNGQILVSSGLHELDVILGGGLPLGSIICIKEDKHSRYCDNLLQYFVSEGIACGQTCAIVTAGENSGKWVDNLPFDYGHYRMQHNKSEIDEEEEKEKTSTELKIAWRYKEFVEKQISEKKATVQKITKSVGSVECHDFDLSKNLQDDLRKEAESRLHHCQESDYTKIFKFLCGVKGDVVRIALQSLGYLSGDGLIQFLYALKGLVRNSSTICMFTIPAGQFDDFTGIAKVCDVVLKMDSFIGSEIDIPELGDFTGMMMIEKLSKLNSLTYNYAPDTLQYLFTRKKRKFYVEQLYLPPEQSRTSLVKEAKAPEKETKIHAHSKDLEF